MFKKINGFMLFLILITVLLVSACSGVSSPQNNPAGESEQGTLADQPTTASLPGSATDQPVPTSLPDYGGKTNADAVVPCAALIPPDELKNLLFVEPESLVENSYPGATSCEWKYTPKDAVQPRLFFLQVGFDDQAVSIWESTRNAELNNEPADLVVISVDGLGDENYTWKSANTGMQVAYVRQGERTLIFRYDPVDVLYMGNESGVIDMSQRIFERLK